MTQVGMSLCSSDLWPGLRFRAKGCTLKAIGRGKAPGPGVLSGREGASVCVEARGHGGRPQGP